MITPRVENAFSVMTVLELTSPEIAQPPPVSMDPPDLFSGIHQTTADATKRDVSFTLHGIVPTTVQMKNPAQKGDVCVHCVAHHPTMHSHAFPSDLLPIITPLVISEWKSILLHTNLYTRFQYISTRILHGFDMGTCSFLSVSFIPCNHSSALQNFHSPLPNTFLKNFL